MQSAAASSIENAGMRTQFRAPQSLRSGDGGFTHRNNDAEAGGGARTAENGEHIVGVDDGTLEELGLTVSYRYR
jgi:hypothetical protein